MMAAKNYLAILSFLFPLLAADPEPRWRELNGAARAALQAKDYAKLRSTLLEMRPLLPGSPRIAYNLAASEAKVETTEMTMVFHIQSG